MKRLLQLALLSLCLVPTVALAHVGVGSTSGLARGFLHPLSGFDHQLAMILVGIFAYQLGGRALWLVPLTFVFVMAVGGFLGILAVPIPFVEIGIAISVIVLGAIVAFGIKAPAAVAMGVVGLFAIFHGHAHGSEMPMDASGVEYGIGFMLATALLHAIGIGIGFLIGLSSKRLGDNVYRVVGGLASIAGDSEPCSQSSCGPLLAPSAPIHLRAATSARDPKQTNSWLANSLLYSDGIKRY